MSSNQTMSFQEWSEEIARHKRTLRYKPETLYISTACYSENTKRMLDELHERIDRSREAAIFSLNIDSGNTSIVDMLLEEQRKIVDRYVRDILCSVPKYTIQNDYLVAWEADEQFNKIKPWFIKTNNEKEKEKMEAKKCERCGKLYEMQDADPYMTVYFPGLSVSDYSKENFSESRIRKDNTRIISVNSRSGQVVDLCPECREKLKEFFESGKDETTVIKKAEE